MSNIIDLGPVTAYALARKHGFQGTEAEWLASLKGDPATDATVPDGSITEAKLAQDVKDKLSKLSEEIANIQGGKDGVTPTIGDNGNWYLGDTDTGKPSRGEAGPQGPAGADGYTPQKGTDYWTAEDQQAIVDDVLAALPTWEGGSY